MPHLHDNSVAIIIMDNSLVRYTEKCIYKKVGANEIIETGDRLMYRNDTGLTEKKELAPSNRSC